MEELNVNLTYGQALFDAATDIGKEKELLEEAKEVRDILIKEPDFLMLVNDPTINGKEKKEIIDNIFAGKISQELLNFFYILIDKRRITHFVKIVDQFEKLANARDGFGTGTVYTVVPLSEEKMLEIEAETSKLLQEKVKLTQEIDITLVGGIKILANGKIIDATIRKKLKDMATQLME